MENTQQEPKKPFYKRLSLPVILTLIIIALTFGVVALLVFIVNQSPTQRGIAPLTQIESMEPDSAKWGVNFPNQYASFLKTQTNKSRTTFGGSEPFDKLARDPMLVTLFKGYSFSKAYGEDRGHLNALTDVRASPRINDKTTATCYSCKSANNPVLWKEMGLEAFDKMAFSAMTPKMKEPIGCANCHEANTMRLIVSNPSLENALSDQGKDWNTFTRQEMRTVVCANCHVEYYMKGDSKLLVFPWKNGTRIEDIETYYDSYEFSDWKHAFDEAPLVKMQHPEYELYTADSTHYKAGVSCADCHMPYTRDGSAKYSSHDVKSPLQSAATSCGACHNNYNDYALERVKTIQNQTWKTMENTEKALVDAINAIADAMKVTNVNTDKLDAARKLHRQAQLRWDFIAAENSMGFHNPEEALRILASATDLARQAQLAAVQSAAGK